MSPEVEQIVTAENHAVMPPADDEILQRWVTFRLADETYGVTVIALKEVLRVTEIAPVPGAAEYIKGVINLRGTVGTVVDTRRRFGLPNQAIDDNSRILITDSGDQLVGFLVDAVSEVVEIDNSQIEDAPNIGVSEAARYITGVVSREDHLLILVDLARCLSDEEWTEIEGLNTN